MSLTPATAIKAFLESQDLDVPIHYRRPPKGERLPHIVVHGPIASPPDPTASPFSGRKRVISHMQIDIWQHEYSDPGPTGKRTRTENPLLPETVAALLDGAQLGGTPFRIYGCLLIDGPREMDEPLGANLAHHVVTVKLNRSLNTSFVAPFTPESFGGPNWRGTYDPSVTYAVGDAVTYANLPYRTTAQVVGAAPPAWPWVLLAEAEPPEVFARVAAVDLSGHRVVTPRADGTVEYASNADILDATKPLWLTLGAALAGQQVQVLAEGEVVEPSWSWAALPVFLGVDGALTQVPPTPPAARFLVQLAGVTAQPTALYFDPRTPIALN